MRIFQAKRGVRDEPVGTLRLVVGLNRVDQIVPGGWDTRLNQPSQEAAKEIQRKCEDVIRHLSGNTNISHDHIEYYSALKRYRLHHVLNRVIRHSFAGFKFADIEPKHFEDVNGVDPDVRQFTKEERARRAETNSKRHVSPRERLFSELSRLLSPEDLREVETKFSGEMRRAPRVAVLGQSGVGKTTTVNAMFATDWGTNPVEVGTHAAQDALVPLPSGGSINIVDLPGYGRSISEDARYERIYREVIPECDLVLLVIQADRGDLADDMEMIIKLRDWLAKSPVPSRGEAR